MMRFPIVVLVGFAAAGFGDASITGWTIPNITSVNGIGTVQKYIREQTDGTTTITLQATGATAYTLTHQSPDGIFSIGQNSGLLSIVAGKKLDHKTHPTHILTVEASDGTDTATATVTIKVAAPPTFSQSAYTVNIADGSKPDTHVIRVKAVVGTASEKSNAIGSYALVDANNTDTDFKVDQNGTITVAKELSIARTPRYALVVTAADTGTPHLTGTATVNVCVGCKSGEAKVFATSVLILAFALIGIILNI